MTRVLVHETITDNLSEVYRLLDIHTEVSGHTRGRKFGVEVLNKSAIVLLVACWESYIEDLANVSFQLLLRNAKRPELFPYDVLVRVSNPLREAKDEREVWKLAGSEWKNVMKRYKSMMLRKLNTPKTKQVDALYSSLLGMKHLSKSWYWRGMTSERASEKLDELVTLRGRIAHRVKAGVRKETVRENIHFIGRIAVASSNVTQVYVKKMIGKEPWPLFEYK